MSEQLLRQASFHRFQHEQQGLTEGALKGRWRKGETARIGHGIYCDAAQWASMTINERYRVRTIRQWERAKADSVVVSHLSAAALWGLPLPSRMPTHVHLSGYRRHRGRTNSDVMRHSSTVPEPDVVELYGVRCTSLARTVTDVALQEPLDMAVMCADAGIRKHVLQSAGRYPNRCIADKVAAEFMIDLEDQISKRAGRRGVKQARFVGEFATWLAESPGESLSRLRMHQVGLMPPELQVEVAGLGPGSLRLDFLFREQGIFGEFDGLTKYSTDPNEARRQILAEKEREDAIRAVTGWRCVRWYWKDIASKATFESFTHRSGLRASSL